MKIGRKLYFVITQTETTPFATRQEARLIARENGGVIVESSMLSMFQRDRLQLIAENSEVN